MFVPPEQRHPGSSPWDPQPPKKPPPRGETAVLWAVGLLLLATLLAPMAGSSVFHALWYVLTR